MPFADLIARTVRDPLTQGNPGEMHRLLDLVDALPQRLQTTPAAVRALLSAVAVGLREPLLAAREAAGDEDLLALVRRGCGLEPDAPCVARILTLDQRAALDDRAAAATGLDPGTVAEALPLLVPIVLKLLDAGSPVRHGDRAPNAILDAFLVENVDMGEAIRLLAASLGARR